MILGICDLCCLVTLLVTWTVSGFTLIKFTFLKICNFTLDFSLGSEGTFFIGTKASGDFTLGQGGRIRDTLDTLCLRLILSEFGQLIDASLRPFST